MVDSRINRRRIVAAALAGAGSALLPRVTFAAEDRPRYASDPFSLGVASGYPTADGMVLWTRLAPQPLASDGGMPPVDIHVHWEIAHDLNFTRLAARGITRAEAAWAHSVHVEVRGLAPGRHYFYRFRSGDAVSEIGRTWTAAAPGANVDRLRVALASCQHYEQGFFAAYRQMVADEPDLIVHVGDYIYESGTNKSPVRKHPGDECYTLADYRLRYSVYRTDPELRSAHAACPWMLTHDDHEVDNDYANDHGEKIEPKETFLARRAAAYRAYYEHLPLPRRARPRGPDMLLYTTRHFGSLLSLHMLDERQYRSLQACPPAGKNGGARVYEEECPEMNDPARTMLGSTQERWVDEQLAGSRSRWNFLAQGVTFTRSNEATDGRHRYWSDAWAGYPAARDRLLRDIVRHRVPNPVVLSGDIHAFIVADLPKDPADPNAAVGLSELVTSSITSPGPPDFVVAAYERMKPQVWYADGEHRGYLRIDVTPNRLHADLVAVDDVRRADSACHVLASFEIEAGTPGLRRV